VLLSALTHALSPTPFITLHTSHRYCPSFIRDCGHSQADRVEFEPIHAGEAIRAKKRSKLGRKGAAGDSLLEQVRARLQKQRQQQEQLLANNNSEGAEGIGRVDSAQEEAWQKEEHAEESMGPDEALSLHDVLHRQIARRRRERGRALLAAGLSR